MTPITWGQLISLCLRDAGVGGMGQTPNSQMQQDTLLRLGFMISEWRESGALIYRMLDLGTAVTGAQTYTVGPGEDFDIEVRPELIDGAYIKQIMQPPGSPPVQFPLRVLKSRLDYMRIAIPTLQAAPSSTVWYDPAYPVGIVHPWPVPTIAPNTWELHLLMRELLDAPDALADEIVLPPVYYRAIYTNLCVDCGTAYRRDPKPMMIRRAAASLRRIRAINAKIPLLTMPRGVTHGPAYNVWSDQGR